MDNVNIFICVFLALLFIFVIYMYVNFTDMLEAQDKERVESEARLCDEISDLKKVASKATVAASTASAAANTAVVTASKAAAASVDSAAVSDTALASAYTGTEGFSSRKPRGKKQVLKTSNLPDNFLAAITSAKEKGVQQDMHQVAQEMYDPSALPQAPVPTAAANVEQQQQQPQPQPQGYIPFNQEQLTTLPTMVAHPQQQAIAAANEATFTHDYTTGISYENTEFIGDPTDQFVLN